MKQASRSRNDHRHITAFTALFLLTLHLGLTPKLNALLIDILVAIATTKLAILGKRGFWATMHDGRTDFCMLLGFIAIALLGAGSLSVDGRRRNAR